MKKTYTPEEMVDIQERVKKANETLKELQLSMVCGVEPYLLPETIAKDVFGFRLTPLLVDLKYNESTIEEAQVVEKKA